MLKQTLFLILITFSFSTKQEYQTQIKKVFSGSMNGHLTVQQTYELIEDWRKIKGSYMIQKIDLGKSYLNNTMYMYGITCILWSESQLKNVPSILLNSLMHSREKNSLVLLLYTFCKLLFDPSRFEQYLLNREVVFFIFHSNIDSSLEIQLLWKINKKYVPLMDYRKNRHFNKSKDCSFDYQQGVDINRNFDFHYAELGNKNPCSQEYYGQHPFSQKQSQIFKQIIQNYDIKLVIDYHSYGNRFIIPYAFDKEGTMIKQNQKLEEYYSRMKSVIEPIGLQMDTSYNYLRYQADGVYIDWVASKNIRSFAYQFGPNFQDIQQKVTPYIPSSLKSLLQILIKNELWIQGTIHNQNSISILSLKSYSLTQIILKPHQSMNTSQQLISITPYSSISIPLKTIFPNNILSLQIIDLNSTFKYQIILNQKQTPQSSYLFTFLLLLLIFIPIIILIYVYITNKLKKSKNIRIVFKEYKAQFNDMNNSVIDLTTETRESL